MVRAAPRICSWRRQPALPCSSANSSTRWVSSRRTTSGRAQRSPIAGRPLSDRPSDHRGWRWRELTTRRENIPASEMAGRSVGKTDTTRNLVICGDIRRDESTQHATRGAAVCHGREEGAHRAHRWMPSGPRVREGGDYLSVQSLRLKTTPIRALRCWRRTSRCRPERHTPLQPDVPGGKKRRTWTHLSGWLTCQCTFLRRSRRAIVPRSTASNRPRGA